MEPSSKIGKGIQNIHIEVKSHCQHQKCKETKKNVTHDEEKKSIQTSPEMTETMQSADRDSKAILL